MNIILTTMVRNESKALPRMIRSAAPIVTHVALTDTGSTDDTVAIARALCAELGLPITVEVNPWSDFGSNRTLNLEHGRRVAVALGDPAQSHLLLLDADMEVPVGVKPLEKSPPDVTMLAQQDRFGVTWWNIRMIRADIQGKYIGRTHEYLSHGSGAGQQSNWFAIIDHCDGGCRSDKFERDERLLRLDLKDNPNNPRTMFYLAQTLQILGRKAEAKSLYDTRARFGDFPEEAWMSRCEAARCAEGFEADVLALEAYFSRPQRAEPLADIAIRSSDQGRCHLALALASIGKQIPYPPKGESLYCNPQYYQWPFYYAEMVSSYYVGDNARGGAACDFLRFTPGSPHFQVALDNAVFYAKAIPGDHKPLAFSPPNGFAPASPCLRKVDGGWVGIIRAVNYQISPSGYFPLISGGWADVEHPITTRNFYVQYNDDWTPRSAPLELLAPRGVNPQALIVGYEDQRIVFCGEDRLVTAGVHCDDSPIGQPELWEATWDLVTGTLTKGRKLSKGDACEKNWLPLPTGGYLYGHWPTTLVDRDGQNPTPVAINLNLNLTGFRGSAAPIPYQGGYLYVVHEVSARGRRTYLHRFVHVKSGRWDGMRISRPFLLRGQPCMESCFSINTTPRGVVLSCAFEDREIYTITTPDDVVTTMLNEGTKA